MEVSCQIHTSAVLLPENNHGYASDGMGRVKMFHRISDGFFFDRIHLLTDWRL